MVIISGLVWYVAYGSNLDCNRFMCYIRGGTPKGSSKREIGCRDKGDPLDSQPYQIPYKLYFAKSSLRWNGGIAFIGLSRDEDDYTLGRAYLISDQQFNDVVAQENGLATITIDYDDVVLKGSKEILKNRMYGELVFLGYKDGHPVFTFTSNSDMPNGGFAKPSKEYINTLVTGLMDIYQMSQSEAEEHVKKKIR